MDKTFLIRYINGESSDQEKSEVIKWIDADPKNLSEFLVYRKLHDLAIWQDSPESGLVKDNKKPVFGSARNIVLELIKIAAILICGLLLFRIFFNEKPLPPVSMQTINVPAGQRAELILADGSHVWLNANTRFTFPTVFDKLQREVAIDGEGYFIVAHNERQPFIVSAGNYLIKNKGTEFNLICYPGKEKFEVSLLSGAVEIKQKDSGSAIDLIHDQMVVMKDKKLFVSPIKHTGYFLWKNGIISFDDEPFPEMVSKLELYFDLKINVENNHILSYRCTGKFRSKDGIEHILKVLQLKNSFTYKIDEKLNIITIN